MGKALVIKGANFANVKVDTIDIIVPEPTISITIAGIVTISASDDVYYTTDGSTPTSSSTKYTAPFSVQQNATVKAIAYNGANYSDVVTAVYDGTLQAPTISITQAGVATITASEDAEHIYYTTDNTTPTTSSTEYTVPITGLENGQVVKAIATAASGSIVSSVASATAVVPERPIFGKKFSKPGLWPTGEFEDDQTRFISPKIPITEGTSYTWVYKNCAYGLDFILEYTSADAVNEFWNVTQQSQSTSGSITKTAKTGTTYLRFSGLIGTSAGSEVTSGGETLWEYDGSTE